MRTLSEATRATGGVFCFLACPGGTSRQPGSRGANRRSASCRPSLRARRGTLQCVDTVVREMTSRFDALAARCDHKAVFSLLYLRTTEEFRRTVAENPQFFRDPAYVNHEDALFADYYFWAMDATGAKFAAVPLAWQIAMDAANRREVSGAGDILLGMHAHINRDLPFVLAAMGLTHPDGSSRKPDHDKVNEILHRVTAGTGALRGCAPFRPVHHVHRRARHAARQRGALPSSS